MKVGADMALKLLQIHLIALTEPTDDEAPPAAAKLVFGLSSASRTKEEAMEPAAKKTRSDAELAEPRSFITPIAVGIGEDSLLWWAVTNGDLGLALYLMSNGADVNISDKADRPLLHVAIELRSLKMLECLIRNGAAIDSKNKAGETVLHIATATRFVQAVSFLASEKADPNILDSSGRSPLQICLFSTQLVSDYGLEAVLAMASVLCTHGATFDSCQRQWQEARDRANSEDSRSGQDILWQVGLGACVQHWIEQRNAQGDRQDIPIEVIKQGEASVATYIANSVKSSVEGGVYRRKICVVGHTTFGKTSLINSVVGNKSCCTETDDRTIGIERVVMTFTARDGEITNHHHITFWDYAGQSIYQSAHSMFFSKRTLYLLCVDLRVYEMMLYPELTRDTGTSLTAKQHSKMMRRFLSEQVFRWVRLVLMRQPDALFLMVGTKKDELKRKDSEVEITADFNARFVIWAKGFLEDTETLRYTDRDSGDNPVQQLRTSLNRIQHDPWIIVSSLADKDARLARQFIEKSIVDTAKERSFKMPDVYVRVLQEIQVIQADANKQPGGRRITSTTMNGDELVSTLARRIPTLDHGSCLAILRTLRELGDLLWFESDGPEMLRKYAIVDPTVVIDVVRGAVNHKRADEDNATLREHGRLMHEELIESPLWCDMDEEFLRAFKELLQFYELAYPTESTMDWDSHLIIPAYRKGNTDFKSEPLMERSSTLSLGGVQLDHVVGWKYELSDEISDTIFDQLCVKSYNDRLTIRAGPEVIEADYDVDVSLRFKLRMAIERGPHQNDYIGLEVAAADRDTCWHFMKWFVLKAQSVVKGYPALKPRCRVFDSAAGTPPQGLSVEAACERVEQAGAFRSQTDLPDLSWYSLETPDLIAHEVRSMKLDLAANIQLAKTHIRKADAIMKLVVTTSDRELPALWVFNYKDDNPSMGEVRLLSTLSGCCFHEPLQITIPPGFMTKYGWLIQNSVNLLGNVADSLIGLDVLKEAMSTAKSAITGQVERAQAVHTLIKEMDSPGASDVYNSTDRPMQSLQLLRELLQLADEVVDERYINTTVNLHCAAVKETGTYVWATREEIKELGDKVIPCNTHVFEAPPPSLTTSTAIASSGTGSNPGLAVAHTTLVIESVEGFASWHCRRMYCAWRLLAPKTPTPLAVGQTPYHTEKVTVPAWTKVFNVECATSLATLREYELHIAVKRESRLPFYGDKTLAQVVLKLVDHVPADSTSAKPVRIENLPLDNETPPKLTVTLSITVPDVPSVPAASSA